MENLIGLLIGMSLLIFASISLGFLFGYKARDNMAKTQENFILGLGDKPSEDELEFAADEFMKGFQSYKKK